MEALYEIEYYEKKNGLCPFLEWLEFQDKTTQARIMARLNSVRLGNFGDTKSVGKDVHEMRLHFGPGYRIYYRVEKHKVVLIFCVGDKTSQKKDIRLAQQYAEDRT